MAPPLRKAGLRGAMLGWDGQLEDDARLVATVARTAASYGAHVRTRARVLSRDRDLGVAARRAHRRDRSRSPPARSSAPPGSGPPTWSTRSSSAPAAAPTWCCARSRCPGSGPRSSRPCRARRTGSCWCCPSPTARSYVGLTDEPADGPVPDVPEPTEPEIGFLLDVVSAAFERRCTAPTWWVPTPGSGRCSTPGAGRDRRHVAQARHAGQPHRRGHDRGRQADDVPPDGRGRRRRGRRARRDRRRRVPDPRRCPCSARPTGSPWPGSSSRRGWSGSTAPTPGWSSRPRAPPPG